MTAVRAAVSVARSTSLMGSIFLPWHRSRPNATVRHVQFDASSSWDPDGQVASYNWNFGDGTDGVGHHVTHTYAAAGTYKATLTVTDHHGATSARTAGVTVQAVVHIGDLDGAKDVQKKSWTALSTSPFMMATSCGRECTRRWPMEQWRLRLLLCRQPRHLHHRCLHSDLEAERDV